MDEQIARTLLARELEPFRARSYADLVAMIDTQTTKELVGPDGKTYQLEFLFFWDSKRGGDVRVIGCIDDCGWRAFCPLSDSFIKSPTGEFVGE